MPCCYVLGCKSRSSRRSFSQLKYERDNQCRITFYEFPKNEVQRNQWIFATGRADGWQPNHHSRVCSIHFAPECFKVTDKIKHLMPGARPSLNLGLHHPKSATAALCNPDRDPNLPLPDLGTISYYKPSVNRLPDIFSYISKNACANCIQPIEQCRKYIFNLFDEKEGVINDLHYRIMALTSTMKPPPPPLPDSPEPSSSSNTPQPPADKEIAPPPKKKRKPAKPRANKAAQAAAAAAAAANQQLLNAPAVNPNHGFENPNVSAGKQQPKQAHQPRLNPSNYYAHHNFENPNFPMAKKPTETKCSSCTCTVILKEAENHWYPN